jgi:hypothetical protein
LRGKLGDGLLVAQTVLLRAGAPEFFFFSPSEP